MKKKKTLFVIIALALVFAVVVLLSTSHLLLTTNAENDWTVEHISPANRGMAISNDGSLWSWWGRPDPDGNHPISDPLKLMENVSQVIDRGDVLILTEDGILLEMRNFYDSWRSRQISDMDFDGVERNKELEFVEIMDDVIRFSADGRKTAAIRSDGSLWVWEGIASRIEAFMFSEQEDIDALLEQNPHWVDYDYVGPLRILENVRFISDSAEAAITYDNSLWTWGRNNDGQIGDGTTIPRIAPIKIMDDVRYVTGSFNKLAIRNDGTLWSWGRNYTGQVGNGNTRDRHTPIQILNDIQQAFTSGSVSMAIRNDGTLWAWGDNSFGNVGNGSTVSSIVAPRKIMDDVLYAVPGNYFEYPSFAIRSDGSLWAWGNNWFGQIGDGTRINRLRPVRIMDNVVYVSASELVNIAVQIDGSLWVWGGGYSEILQRVHNDASIGTRPIRVMENVRLSILDDDD